MSISVKVSKWCLIISKILSKLINFYIIHSQLICIKLNWLDLPMESVLLVKRVNIRRYSNIYLCLWSCLFINVLWFILNNGSLLNCFLFVTVTIVISVLCDLKSVTSLLVICFQPSAQSVHYFLFITLQNSNASVT